MSDFDCNFSMELKYPLDAETLDILTDAELNKTNRIWFVTKSGKKVPFVKVEALDKAKTVIEEHIKINQNLKPNDTKVMRWCLDVIDKYTAESDNESCDEIWEKAYKEREGKKMNGSFELTLNNPLAKEDWDKIADVELENTPSITFKTPKGKQVKYIKSDLLDKIRAEIQRLRGCSCSCSDGIIDDVEDILDKYTAGSEE